MFKTFTATAVICGAVLVATSAPVVAQPSIAWQASLSGEVTPARMFGHVDGKVTVAACGAPSGDTAQAKTYGLSATDPTTNVANNGASRLYACTGQSTLGKDGTLYTSGVLHSQSRLLAYKDGQLKWSKAYPVGCDDVSAMTIGVNGNVYAVVSCNGSYRLVGYTSDVAPGSSEPSIPLDVTITGQFGTTNDSLAAYDDGLVVQLNNGLQYFTYSGIVQRPVIVDDFRQTQERAIATSTNGFTFYPVAASSSKQTACGAVGWGVMDRIESMTPYGIGWQYHLSDCTHVISIRPLLDGGAVAEIYDYGTDGAGTAERKLVVFSRAGLMMWEHVLDSAAGSERIINNTMTVTIRGDILVQQTYELRGHTGINARKVRLQLLSGATGQMLTGTEFMGESKGYMIDRNIQVATTQRRAYVSIVDCNWDYCGANRTLYALEFDGAFLDYPRGAAMKYDEPWRNYAALGDSYAAALGAGSSIPPSDISGCHRSENAYAKLLDGSPALRLRLGPGFVACSGAKTENVLYGMNGEVSQLNVLNRDTDFVTISIGGNDVDFVGLARACIFDDCSQIEGPETIRKIREELPAKLDAVYAAIRLKASSPNVRILVIGYPMLIPEQVDQNLPYCLYLQNDGDTARTVITTLNNEIAAAVTRAGTPFEFVDPNTPGSPFIGHELCKSSGSYFHGLVAPPNEGWTFHLNIAGQQALRQIIAQRLSDHF